MKNLKVALASLGCSKNLIDAEQMMGIIEEAGFEIVENEADADILIVNTCTFIEQANTESIECILEFAQYRKSGDARALIVTGCLAQRYKEQVLSEIPEVDAVVGVNEFDKIADVIREIIDGGDENKIHCSDELMLCDGVPRTRTTPPYTAFVKIAEGCSNRCTYCIIPYVRGDYRSRDMDSIVSEAEKLAEEGVREIILVAQDSTRYGKDLYGRYKLPELLKRLCKIEKLKWIRIHYCYPELVTDELLETMANEEKICNYLDIPIQHINDEILKRMGRRTNRAQIEKVIKRARELMDDVVIRTSLIVGFPGETEEQFEELREFVENAEIERLGVFTYSREEDTPAYDFENQVDEEVKQHRQDVIMMVQSAVSQRLNDEKIGSVVKVLTEGRDEIVKSYYGRTYADSSEVDGKVFFKSDEKIEEGQFVDVRIEQALEYDLFGKAE